MFTRVTVIRTRRRTGRAGCETEGTSLVLATIDQHLVRPPKRSVARVFLRPARARSKSTTARSKTISHGKFARRGTAAFAATETMEKFDILILADGGGVAGQRARPLGIAGLW